jgi:stage II sporulation protein D
MLRLPINPRPLAAVVLVGAVIAAAVMPTACSVTDSPSSSSSLSRDASPSGGASYTKARQSATPPGGPGGGVFERLTGEPDIRVRLTVATAGIEVGGPAQVRFTPLARPGSAVTLKTPVTVTRGDSGWVLLDATRQPTLLLRGSTAAAVDLLSIEPAGLAGETLKLNKREYPGIFRLIEHVPAESYLAGVISKELFASWSLEAFKAQAVAARSYALQEREMSLARGEPYDVESTEADQAYDGKSTNPTALRAVRETAGMVLTWQGRVLRAYYSSTCGGRAAAARDIWPVKTGFEYNTAAPIQDAPRDDSCANSPLFRWTVTRDLAELTRRITHYGRLNNFAIRNVKQLTKVEPHDPNPFGRARAYKLYDADGKWYPLTAEQLRIACNTSVPASTPAEAAPPTSASAPNAKPQPIAPPLPAIPSPTRESRVNSGDLEFEFAGGTGGAGPRVIIRGRGFGHGCGMCQYGTEGMAKKGTPHTAILNHFYPGARLERAY